MAFLPGNGAFFGSLLPRNERHKQFLGLSGVSFRNQEKGVLRGGFLQTCTPLLAVALWVPNVLLGPISLGIFCFLGRDTGLYLVNLFLIKLVRGFWFSFLFTAIAVFFILSSKMR